ncbi:MAG: hypothetical protein F6K55_26015 [Moorea sp. SIO4A3]|nr:hypothetical protein [Moorena sp. SIO4A3]
MARIAINDIQESESFLTELLDTDVAMDQINGGFLGRRLLRLFFLGALLKKLKKNPYKSYTYKPKH